MTTIQPTSGRRVHGALAWTSSCRASSIRKTAREASARALLGPFAITSTDRRRALTSKTNDITTKGEFLLPNLNDRERGTLRRASQILGRHLKSNPIMDSPAIVRDFLACKLGHQTREVFAVMYLNAQHELIEFVEEFLGTLTSTHVYPRELLKRALLLNASAVVLAHNHPSGQPEPSAADEALTRAVKQAMETINVRTLDHIVVGGGQSVSFAERGLL